MLLEKQSSCFEGLKFPLQLGYSDDSRDKLDPVRLEEVLVLALRVFADQTHARGSRVHKRVFYRTVCNNKTALLSIAMSSRAEKGTGAHTCGRALIFARGTFF